MQHTDLEGSCDCDESLDDDSDRYPRGDELRRVPQPVSVLTGDVRSVNEAQFQEPVVEVHPPDHVADEEPGVGAPERRQIVSGGRPSQSRRHREDDETEDVARQTDGYDDAHGVEVRLVDPIAMGNRHDGAFEAPARRQRGGRRRRRRRRLGG